MLISRGAQVFKTLCKINSQRQPVIYKNEMRNIISYRGSGEPSKPMLYYTETLMGIVWWWTFWNLYHSWDDLTKGHIRAPPASWYTDEELGIPPDNAD